MNHQKKVLLLFLLVCMLLGIGAFFLVARTYYVDLSASQKRDSEVLGSLDKEHTLAQEIISKAPYLSRIDISFLSAGYPELISFKVIVHLQDSLGKNIATASYLIPQTAEEFTIKLQFRPQGESLDSKYTLVIETDAPSNVLIPLGSAYDSYPDGRLLVNGAPINDDLAFASYSKPSPSILIRETFQKSSTRFLYIIIIGIGFWLLGFLITTNFGHPESAVEQIIYPFVVGIAIPPTALFFLSLLGIRLTRNNLALALMIFLIFSIIWKLIAKRDNQYKRIAAHVPTKELMILLVLLAAATFTRVVQINDLVVPSGVGGIAHQKILDRLVRKEKIPTDSIYHMGFHSNVFLLYELTKMDLPEASLLLGQFLGIVSGLSFYMLGRRVLRHPLYALFSAALFWFIAPIPALLVNWGRYPLLQGLTILPIGLLFFGKENRYVKSNGVVLSIILSGLLFSHYGMFLILFVFSVILLLKQALTNRLDSARVKYLQFTLATIIFPILVVFIAKAYLIFPKAAWGNFIENAHLIYTYNDYVYFFGHTLKNGGLILWIIGSAGYLLKCWQNRSLLLISFLWMVGLLLLDSLQIALLGHSATRPVNLLYFLSIPLAIFAGFATQLVFRKFKPATYLFIAFGVLIGGYNIGSVVDPQFVFFTAADRQAISWIKSNIPQDSIFLVNSYPYDGVYKPEDGGAWLPYVAKHKIRFLNSADQYEDSNRSIRQLPVDYVYIGSGYGELATDIVNHPEYVLVYSKEGRFIYMLKK